MIEIRAPGHVAWIAARLQAGDRDTAAFVGLPLERFTGTPLDPLDQITQAVIAPVVQRAATVASFNEAWLLLGLVVAVSLLALPLIKPPNSAS